MYKHQPQEWSPVTRIFSVCIPLKPFTDLWRAPINLLHFYYVPNQTIYSCFWFAVGENRNRIYTHMSRHPILEWIWITIDFTRFWFGILLPNVYRRWFNWLLVVDWRQREWPGKRWTIYTEVKAVFIETMKWPTQRGSKWNEFGTSMAVPFAMLAMA